MDVRRIDVLGPIMESRLDMCEEKGFDGVEPDNVDGYLNDTGFPLTKEDQLSYNIRRVKPTPGSQLALFAKYSYHGFITDRDGELLELEADHLVGK